MNEEEIKIYGVQRGSLISGWVPLFQRKRELCKRVCLFGLIHRMIFIL